MIKADAEEAAAIADVVLSAILDVTPTKGRPGADLRTAIGDFKVKALPYIHNDLSGLPLANIFDLARQNAVSLPQLASVRAIAANEAPATLGGILMKNSLIMFSLSTEARIIADTTFKSRQEAVAMKDLMNVAFDDMELAAADDMDSETYRALITLHAAVTEHLVTAERPLPYMLNFRFAAPNSTLVFAYKLYDDAGRADQLREENSVVHPLFALPYGRALAS